MFKKDKCTCGDSDTPKVTAVCGFKDVEGKFHLTEDEALSANVKSEIAAELLSLDCQYGGYARLNWREALDYICKHYSLIRK